MLLTHLAKAQLVQRLDGEPFRRPAAGVQTVQLIGLCVIDNGEEVATDTIHHRRDHAHHRVRGNGCIDRIAAALQNPRSRLGRQGRFSGHDAVARDHHGARLRAVLTHCNWRRKHGHDEQGSPAICETTSHVAILR